MESFVFAPLAFVTVLIREASPCGFAPLFFAAGAKLAGDRFTQKESGAVLMATIDDGAAWA
jgi:hypothetical protein